LLAIFWPQGARAEFVYQRLCNPGETRLYELERRVYQDDSMTYRANAVSSHNVLGCEPYSESVLFSGLLKFAGRDPIDLSKAAAAFPGFSIALASNATQDDAGPSAPALADADQTLRGLARDLQQVIVSAASAAGSGRLRKVGDSYISPALRKDRRSATPGPGVREVCSEVRMGLVDLTPTRVSLRTSLSAPDSPCLVARKPWAEAPIESDGQPNNYQQVSCSVRTCSVSWGHERTVVDAVLDRKTGALLSAELEDVREFKERTGCDGDLEHCSPEASQSSRRRFKMKLHETPPWQEK
jgi:hypothetical protein